MKKFVGGMVVGIIAFMMIIGMLMLGSKYASTTTVTVTSNLDPNPRVITETIIEETTTWENVEVEDWD